MCKKDNSTKRVFVCRLISSSLTSRSHGHFCLETVNDVRSGLMRCQDYTTEACDYVQER